MSHPYRSAPSRAFWARSVARSYDASSLIDGVLIRPGENVVSAGSCFAANLVPHLEKAGLTYLRTEPQHPAFARTEPENFGYAKFSAAYGNLYTSRQLRQLLARAQGQFSPAEDRWHENGRVIDPLRPALRYPARSDTEFDQLTAQHLRQTLSAFNQADVFIFTLGLTEAWVSTLDGTVFPACPGTIAGTFDPDRHEFRNFGVDEVADDLSAFVTELRKTNPDVRFILTVSPVPLVATATGDHVLSATIYSKSVLRVAAQLVADRHEAVSYFPSYEIITGPQAPFDFFEADRRSVTQKGIDVVMEAFLSHCEASGVAGAHTDPTPAKSVSEAMFDAECEEEMVNG